MKISEIQIIPIKANNGLVGFANILFDDCLFLGSIGIHKNLNKDGYRITYPTKKVGDKDINIFHPINKEASRLIEDKIVFKAEQIFG